LTPEKLGLSSGYAAESFFRNLAKRGCDGDMKLTERISNARAAFRGNPLPETVRLQDENVSLKRDLAKLGFELVEAKEAIDALRSRLTNMEVGRINSGREQLESLLYDLAAPVAQLRMQQQLVNSGKEVSGRSIMALASQVADLLERTGLEPIGETGQEIHFDPQTAEPLAADVIFSPGQTVVIRFIGYQYQGRIIRRALVEGRD
jgi:molecular chaperone GrpE (heat shock protein)